MSVLDLLVTPPPDPWFFSNEYEALKILTILVCNIIYGMQCISQFICVLATCQFLGGIYVCLQAYVTVSMHHTFKCTRSRKQCSHVTFYGKIVLKDNSHIIKKMQNNSVALLLIPDNLTLAWIPNTCYAYYVVWRYKAYHPCDEIKW